MAQGGEKAVVFKRFHELFGIARLNFITDFYVDGETLTERLCLESEELLIVCPHSIEKFGHCNLTNIWNGG